MTLSVQQAILNSLLSAQGSALSTSPNSYMYAECYAIATALASIYALNITMQNEVSGINSIQFLSRWETILNINALSSDTISIRQGRIASKLFSFGTNPTLNVIQNVISLALGIYGVADGYFITILGRTPNQASQSLPNQELINGFPDGYYIPEGIPYSSLANIIIILGIPASVSIQSFLAVKSTVSSIIAPILPAWQTVTSGIYNTNNSMGFLLGQPNLGLELLREHG